MTIDEIKAAIAAKDLERIDAQKTLNTKRSELENLKLDLQAATISNVQ